MNRTALVFGLAVAGLALGSALVLASGRLPGAAAPGRVTVPAPVDRLDVRVQESSPPQYALNVVAGLPGGCAQRDRHEVRRDAETITVTVLNSMPAGDVACTMLYGTYELNINLGSAFSPGTAYTVRVNDRTTTFTAR